MGVRRESVELSLNDVTFTSGMARAAASAALLNRELRTLDNTSVRANRSTTALGSPSGGIAKTGTEARRASSDLDRYSGRLQLILGAATTLGPALLPIGATAIPALTSLTAGLGVTVGAVGTAVLAFHGLGDALTALNQYQLDPTEAHFKKLQETFGKLSPAAQDLVVRLDSLGPVVERLQRAAQNGLFPGVDEGLSQVLTLLPEVETIVSRLATEMGRLTTQAGVSLAHDADWQAFFHWLETDAVRTLDDFARATGNFIAGIGSMLVAFQGLDRDFTTGLLRMSRGFREWAATLDQNSSFQDFVDYVRENGPAVGRFFAALGDAFVGLVRAAAPWGSVMLPLLTDTAKIFAVIADSPIGPPLFAAAAGMLALNRASALLGSQGLAKVTGGLTGLGAALRTMPADLLTVHRGFGQVAAAQTRLGTSFAKLGEAAKLAAGPAGMIALIDGMGRATTAASTLEMTIGGALTGFAIGNGPGALIGTISGLLLAYAGNSDTASEAARNFARTLDEQTGALTQNSRAWALEQIGTDNLAALKDAGVNLETLTTALVAGGSEWTNYRAQMESAFGLSGNSKGVLFRSAADDATVKVDELASTIKQGKASWQLFAEAGGEAATATRDYGSAAGTAIITTADLTKKLDAQRASARKSASEWMKFGSNLDDTKVSLNSWINSLADQAKALRDFTKNTQTAAKRGLREGLIKELEAAGPAGALRMKQLANATDAEIKKANKAWKSGQDAIRAYQNMVVPPKKIDIDSDGAISAIEALRARLNSLPKRVTSHIDIVQRGFDSKRAGGFAGGGYTGLGGKFEPAGVVHRREFVFSSEATDGNEAFLDGLHRRLRGYAEGGLVGDRISGVSNPRSQYMTASLFGIDIDRDDSLKKRLRLFGLALDKSKKALDDETSARDSLIGSVKSNLMGDLWGGPSSPFSGRPMPGSVLSVNDQLRQDIRNANEQSALERQLRARGVSGDALREVIERGGLAGLRSFSTSPDAQLRDFQQLYGQRAQAVGEASSTAAGLLGITSEISKERAEIATLNATVKRLEKQLNRQHQENKRERAKTPAKTGAALVAANNKSAKNARTR